MKSNQQLVLAWIKATEQDEETPGKNSDNWAIQELIDICLSDDHETIWNIILEIINSTESEWVLNCVGAGPLEYFLTKYASNYLDRIANQVEVSPKFKKALSSVWLDKNDTKLYKQIYKIAEIDPPFE